MFAVDMANAVTMDDGGGIEGTAVYTAGHLHFGLELWLWTKVRNILPLNLVISHIYDANGYNVVLPFILHNLGPSIRNFRFHPKF